MELPESLNGEYCLFLRDITLDLRIGVLPEERSAPQPVVINVAMYLHDPGKFSSENIADYVSYADVFNDIKRLQRAGGHIELVENLAETVAAIGLKPEAVQRVVVSIEKTDIIAQTRSVGVVIERRK